MDSETPFGKAPRWLTPAEMATWLSLVSVIRTLPAELDRAMRRDARMTLFDYLVLAMLSEAEERTLTCSDLAHLVDGTMSRLSHALDRLSAQGLIERGHTEEDRRVVRARLTDEGLAVVQRVAPRHVDAVRALVFDVLSAEQVLALGEACTSISRNRKSNDLP